MLHLAERYPAHVGRSPVSIEFRPVRSISGAYQAQTRPVGTMPRSPDPPTRQLATCSLADGIEPVTRLVNSDSLIKRTTARYGFGIHGRTALSVLIPNRGRFGDARLDLHIRAINNRSVIPAKWPAHDG